MGGAIMWAEPSTWPGKKSCVDIGCFIECLFWHVQGLWRQRHLRTQEDQEPVQGLWRQRPMRTQQDQEQVQGLRRQRHLRTPEDQEKVQGLSRASARERLN